MSDRGFRVTHIRLLASAVFSLSLLLGACGGSSSSSPWSGTKQLGASTADTEANGVATDGSGNVYVAGWTNGDLDGNTLTGTDDFFVTKYDSSGTKKYTKQLGASTADTEANGVTTDGSGNVYVAGYTRGNLDGNTLAGSFDFFVTKYNSSGKKQYTRQLGVASADTEATGVATDGSGNVYVAGFTNGNLDGQTLTGSYDFFVTKYDSSGAKQNTKLLGVASGTTQAMGVATDASGNVYVAGWTDGDLDGQTLTGSQDFFVTKYDSSGTKQWTKLLGASGGGSTQAYGVATDSSGNVYVAGYTSGNLDGQTLTGYEGSFVTKYDSSGTKQTTKLLAVSGAYTEGNAVATDGSGNVYVAGWTTGNLDGQTLTGTQDFFVAQYDSSVTKQYTRLLGASGAETDALGVATDSGDNFYVTGYTRGNLDGNTLTGGTDFFVTKYDSSGVKQ